MPSFTLDQLKAHDALRHLSVTANAGSGKTRVLVNRYCDLVEFGGAMPREIAAITFTEKASAELRSRIAAAFEERLDDPARHESWDRLKAAREELTSAVIATIHGFCAQLLREFPIETEVPPNFSILGGYERGKMLEDALMEGIERALSDQEGAAYQVARRIGREKMEEILRLMLSKREVIEYSRRHGILARDREETLALWASELDRTARKILLDGGTLRAIERLVGALKPAEESRARELLEFIRTAPGADEILAGSSDLITSILCTKDARGLRRSSYGVKDDLPLLDGAFRRVSEAYRRLSRLLTGNATPAHDERLLYDARILLALYDDVLRSYDARKLAVGALDFEDLQLRLLTALEDGRSGPRIAGRFRYLMIDEFQDTNELQYAIARRMLEGLRFGNLCIVGDRKQSIYGFRNAEVAVFDEANGEIVGANAAAGFAGRDFRYRDRSIPAASVEESLGLVSLDASFRLLPSLCAYVNAACAPLMTVSDPDDGGVSYEPLVCARTSSGATPSEGGGPKGGGNVELLLPGPQISEQCDALWCPESEMIARRILGLVAGGEPVVMEPGPEGREQARAAAFSDVAILCRKRSHFPPLEAALRSYGIPFVTFGGVGFYRTQEIYDLLSYLRTLVDRHDQIALLGLLRSPYFCVSDVELYRLRPRGWAEEAGGGGLWERAVARCREGLAEPALMRAVEIIEDDRALAGRVPIPMLIRRVVERTGWRGAVIGAERGEQNLANVDKLLEMAREFEARGFTNLFDFVERITDLVENEELEGEAVVTTGRDAVRLMTMHGAKGLEFPVVILPSLHASVRAPAEPFFDKKLGFGWNWKFNHAEYRPAATALMALRDASRSRAEEARLFYVAATRARDMLILSGEYDPEDLSEETMLAWALGPFGMVPAENVQLTLVSDELLFLAPDGATRAAVRWEQRVSVHRTIVDLPRHAPFPTVVRPFRSDLVSIGTVPARASGEVYSATQLLAYSQCPTKYYLTYRLGLPEELGAAYAIDPDRRDTEEGTLYARLFRFVAARLDTVAGADGIDPERLSLLVEEALATVPLTAARQTSLRDRLLRAFLRMFTGDEVPSLLFPDDARARVEYELTIPFDDGFLLGVVDRVLESDDGELSIVHFKTIDADAAALERLTAEYLPQIGTYAYLLMQSNPGQASVAATLVFACAPELPQRVIFTRADLERIEENLRRGIAEIRALTYGGGGSLPLRSPHCPECPYWIEGKCLLGKSY